VTTLARLLRLLGPFRWQIVAAVALGVATVGSGVGLMATAAFLIASAALQPSIAELQVAIVGVRFFGVSRGLFRYLERLVSHQLTLRLLGRLRQWFFRALEPLAPARIIEMRSSDLLTRAVADVESLQELFIRAVAPPLVTAVVAVGAAVILGSYDFELALAFFVAFFATSVLVSVGVLELGRRTGGRLTAVRSELGDAVADGVQGMADLLAFGQGSRQEKRVVELSRRTEAARERAARREALGSAGVTFATHATVWLVLVLGIPMVGEGRFTGVGLAVVCLVAIAAFEAVQPLPAAARGLSDQLAAAERIFAVLDAEPAVGDPEEPCRVVPPGLRDSAEPVLELRHLGFTYPGAGEPALRDLDLGLRVGTRVAVVGPSGAGKSTLVHLLLRFWDPTKGEIRLGGRRLDSYSLESLRSAIGVLPQRTDLFTGTIRDNLLLAVPGADQEQLDRAAERAELLDTIRGLPSGWETWIGEHGMQLSGGQRRRLALARLLLRDPSIVVLDEPTSGLDPVTEGRVMRSLLNLFEGRTTILISHRLVAVEALDEIVVLDGGRMVERGDHRELLVHDGLYRRLHDAQNLELVTFGQEKRPRTAGP
jgi:thiol reductant ABC exporter CydC subunit